MLSRCLTRSQPWTSAQCIQSRTFFDYIAESKPKPKQAVSERKDFSKYSWKWVDDLNIFFKDDELKMAELRDKFLKVEGFVAREAQGRTSIDFDKYRAKIADPSFVDEMEIDFKSKKACLESINNTSQLKKWKKDSLDEFANEVREAGDVLLQDGDLQIPRGPGKLRGYETTELADKLDQVFATMKEDHTLDFEHLDAERNMFTQQSQAMRFASQPQWAEYYEDYQAAHLTDQEYSVGEHVTPDFIKFERLKHLRDESERAKWLAEYEERSRIFGILPH